MKSCDRWTDSSGIICVCKAQCESLKIRLTGAIIITLQLPLNTNTQSIYSEGLEKKTSVEP